MSEIPSHIPSWCLGLPQYPQHCLKKLGVKQSRLSGNSGCDEKILASPPHRNLSWRSSSSRTETPTQVEPVVISQELEMMILKSEFQQYRTFKNLNILKVSDLVIIASTGRTTYLSHSRCNTFRHPHASFSYVVATPSHPPSFPGRPRI